MKIVLNSKVPDSELLFRIAIPGRPYVKKNNQRAVGNGRFKKILYTPQYLSWEEIAMRLVLKRKQLEKIKTIDCPVNLSARFHFENKQAEPDLSGLYEGIQDVLEKAGILKNDKLILSHDGSGKFFYTIPRVEVELTRKT